MAASKVAAQRALRGPTNLTIPKGTSPLPKVAAKVSQTQVRNDHLSNRGGSGRGGRGKG